LANTDSEELIRIYAGEPEKYLIGSILDILWVGHARVVGLQVMGVKGVRGLNLAV
jgi:hypothetical protein